MAQKFYLNYDSRLIGPLMAPTACLVGPTDANDLPFGGVPCRAKASRMPWRMCM